MEQAQYDLLWELLECPECTGGRAKRTVCGGLLYRDGRDEDGEPDYRVEECGTCSGNGIRPDIVAYHWETLEDLVADADQITVLPYGHDERHYLESAEIMVGALFVWLASGAEQSEAA